MWFEIGRLRMAANQDDLALAAFDHAHQVDPALGTVELHRGLALRRLGRLDEANVAFAQAAELEPALTQESLLLRGSDEITAGRKDIAAALLEQAIDVDPGTEVRAVRGCCCRRPRRRRRPACSAGASVCSRRAAPSTTAT